MQRRARRAGDKVRVGGSRVMPLGGFDFYPSGGAGEQAREARPRAQPRPALALHGRARENGVCL